MKCLFNYSNDGLKEDDLTIAYISTLVDIVPLVLNQKIISMQLERSTLFFYSKDISVVIICTCPNPELIEQLITTLHQSFLLYYGEFLELSVIQPEIFEPFEKIINEILNNFFKKS